MGNACGSPAPATTAKAGTTKTTINGGKPTTKSATPAPAVKGGAGMTSADAQKTLNSNFEQGTQANLKLTQELNTLKKECQDEDTKYDRIRTSHEQRIIDEQQDHIAKQIEKITGIKDVYAGEWLERYNSVGEEQKAAVLEIFENHNAAFDEAMEAWENEEQKEVIAPIFDDIKTAKEEYVENMSTSRQEIFDETHAAHIERLDKLQDFVERFNTHVRSTKEQVFLKTREVKSKRRNYFAIVDASNQEFEVISAEIFTLYLQDAQKKLKAKTAKPEDLIKAQEIAYQEYQKDQGDKIQSLKDMIAMKKDYIAKQEAKNTEAFESTQTLNVERQENLQAHCDKEAEWNDQQQLSASNFWDGQGIVFNARHDEALSKIQQFIEFAEEEDMDWEEISSALVARKEEIDGELEGDINDQTTFITQLSEERGLEVRRRLLLLQLELFMAKRISATWVGLLDDELVIQANNQVNDEAELNAKIEELKKGRDALKFGLNDSINNPMLKSPTKVSQPESLTLH